MKFILESWRKYIAEESLPVVKLRIFDFDDTIAYTDSAIRVETPEGEILEFDDQLEWDKFLESHPETDVMEERGYKFDFSDYSKVKNPEENEMITKIISDVIEANKRHRERELYVITARGPEAVRPIKRYLKSLGLNPKEFTGVIGLDGGSKREEIERIINKHSDSEGVSTIQSIHFFDDSEKNLEDVLKLRDSHPEISDIRIKQVVRGDIHTLE